jgi:acetyl-CoA acyltransferase
MRTSKGALMMGITAEFLAQTQGITREDQDRFALASHQKATAAYNDTSTNGDGEAASSGLSASKSAAGSFSDEIIPLWGRDESGHRILIERDQCVRPDTSLDQLSALPPAFMPGMGTVTAGNSSPLNDGAAALLIMSEDRAKSLGLKPLAKVRATAVAGVDPAVMGTGPVPATQKALKRAGIKLDDIDLIEINEAFAAQALACIRMLKMDESKVNVRGGAIAIGHPLGASGARIATTLIHAMHDRGASLGLATMCIGVGQGIAVIFERV